MPHFIVECSDTILKQHSITEICTQLHQAACDSGLFIEADIKVRVTPYQQYFVGGKQQDFIHVFASIMQGRTSEQKAALSKAMVTKLASLFNDISNIAMNIDDFDKASYCNRKML